MRLVLGLAIAAGVAGCGGETMGGPPDLGSFDSHLGVGCSTVAECDDGNPCTQDICSPSHVCSNPPVDCSTMTDACNNGVCNATTGACGKMPVNESMVCMDTAGKPGICTTGTCVLVPQCMQTSSTPLTCSDLTTPDTTVSATNVLSSYACAMGETGPELAYPFNPGAADRMVTVSLTGATVDLDLIVLQGKVCTSTAACANPMLSGGGFQGITTGTGTESVTFTAKANTDYLFVVDGRAGAKGTFTLNISCPKICNPTKQLACNQSYMGNTTTSSVTTTPMTSCPASDAGPADEFYLTQSVDTGYKLTLSGLTQDLDLQVVFSRTGMECDDFCKASAIQPGTANETVSFPGFVGSNYDVIIGSKTTTGGPYMLQVDCPPSCASSNSISCGTPGFTGASNGPNSTNVINSWACDPNTTGHEVVYHFSPSVLGSYTFTLSGLAADLDLIVVEGGISSCDPTVACVASSVTAGTANETVTFMADPIKDYWIAVDGKAGASSPFTLRMTSSSCPPPDCSNFADNLSCSYLEDARRNDDSARSANAIDNWVCDMNTTGPEVVYTFTPTVAGNYQVTLDGLAADLDLIVTANASAFTCDPTSACVASSTTSGTASESLSIAADTAHSYYIAVDGKNGAVSPYHIKLAGSSCPAPICQNGYHSLACNGTKTYSNSNDANGATNDVSSWGTCDSNTTGPEFAHKFTPTHGAGPYTIQMIGLTADLDLIVIEAGAGLTCSPSSPCVTSSVTPGTANESVTFTADPAKTYWIVVDGKNGAISNYTIAITAGC